MTCVASKQRLMHLQGMHAAYVPREELSGGAKGVKGSQFPYRIAILPVITTNWTEPSTILLPQASPTNP